MANQFGHGKIVTDGLVLCLDANDANSYPGEPTTNVVNTNGNGFNPLDMYTWSSTGNTSTWSRDSSITSPIGGIPVKEISSGEDSYSSTYSDSWYNLSSASSGETWTASVYVKSAAGTAIALFLFEANSGGEWLTYSLVYHTATGNWDRISVTRTLDNASTAYVQSRVATNTNGAILWWDGLQVEKKAHVTQFTATSRPYVDGWKDLSGNNNHGNLISASYDSNAQIYFDGTITSIYLDINSWIRTTDYITISGWYYHSSDTDGAPWGIQTDINGTAATDGFWWHTKYNNGAFYLRTEDNVNGESDGTGTPFVVSGNWYHITTIVGTNSFKVYKNGVLYWDWIPNNGFSWSNINSDNAYFVIGHSYVAAINGYLKNVQLYNKMLSPSEILQNYNAQKTRYNI